MAENLLDQHFTAEAANKVWVSNITCVGKGSLDGAVVDVRIILQIALKANCPGLMLSHNHPSGSTKPSQQDIQITKQLKDECKAVGIQLIDHLIMTDESYLSFADEGLI